ncbi:hypothetical protein GCM10010508_41110 [Streptomyces naganishii JCM 4654]|uniref:Uncharacterized protein n=1 Tax=Streptomyces naganishii JCM 4654 TaxID=1306179 RepID=A0A919CWA7_9ACTN|nr:hypothetical protein GCM10010508_41110 [Streptomyces naganishii JCM 4654]
MGLRTSAVVYGFWAVAQLTSRADASWSGRAVPRPPEGVAVARYAGRLRYVPPVPEPPVDDPRDDVEVSWSWRELLHPPPPLPLPPPPRCLLCECPREKPVSASTTTASTAVNLTLRPHVFTPVTLSAQRAGRRAPVARGAHER